MRYQIKALVITGLSALACNVQAAATSHMSLTEIGPGLIYDADLNLTWLQDGNFANSRMNWADAKSWAASLSFAGLGGWRLPGLLPNKTDCLGADCQNTELGHLFYSELGGQAGQEIVDNVFKNVQASVYWMQESVNMFDMNLGWGFVTGGGVLSGYQNVYNASSEFQAWAVHDGDIRLDANYSEPASIPVPAAVWLFGSGLIGLLGGARKRTLA